MLIHAIHRRVVQMRNAQTENADALPNIKETRTKVVDQNVRQTRTAVEIGLVCEVNVPILVLERVVKMHNVKSLITFQYVRVQMAILAIRFQIVDLPKLYPNQNVIHAIRHRAVPIASAETLMIMLYVHVYKDLSEHRLSVDPSVSLVVNVLKLKRVSIINASIRVAEHVA